MHKPTAIIIAGPNGAGKTTFAREFLPREAGCRVFLNADLIAAGLSPFEPEKVAIRAGRLLLDIIDEHVARRESFAFETTLSGLGYARKIREWQTLGFRVELTYLRLCSAELALERVSSRVRQGGHSIPAATIQRRFDRGGKLLGTLYKPLVDRWSVYDNSGPEPVLLEWSHASMMREWKAMEPSPSYEVPAGIDDRLKGALAAMHRAAKRAHEVARQTGTDIVIMRDGQIVHIPPDALEADPQGPTD